MTVLLVLTVFGCAHQPPPIDPPAAALKATAPPAKVSPGPAAGTAAPAGEAEFLDENLDFLEEETPALVVADPLAPWNRAVFVFNDRLYFWLLKPAARGYVYITPDYFRTRLRNFFSHLGTPLRMAGCLLQGKWTGAGTEFSRFVLNTVWGGAGFWDAAGHLTGLEAYDEDLGQALGSYGLGNGLYLVWPFFGPSTLRDSFGLAGDRYLSPVTYLQPLALSIGVTGLHTINATSFRLGDYETIINAAMDPYEAIRDGYIQMRQSKIAK